MALWVVLRVLGTEVICFSCNSMGDDKNITVRFIPEGLVIFLPWALLIGFRDRIGEIKNIFTWSILHVEMEK